MIVLGLTGSIGMGKTTAAAIFRQFGVPVFDADGCVRKLYEGPAVDRVEALFPGVAQLGRINRKALAEKVLGDPESMAKLEGLVHPLVTTQREEFLSKARSAGAELAVLDLPLLFEVGAGKAVDGVVVVTASAAEQRFRVLSRPGMSEKKFETILGLQLPDWEKRKQAHFIIGTHSTIESTKRQIKTLISALSFCG